MGESAAKGAGKAALVVGGQKVPLNRFAESALVGVVEGFLGALHDVGQGDVTIVIPAERRAPARRS